MNPHDPKVPETIGRYRIVRPLGSGAMGDVYLAEDPNIDRQLAIKTVRVLGGSTDDIRERQQRLLREARAAGRFLHPNVVALFDADEAAGVLYLAFEYVPGTDLARRVAVSPPLTLRQALTILRQVASALDYAHGQGIVHRDIKPSNILITPEGDAKVADFGIAKLEAASVELTRTGSVVGSPQYMSPEQVRGEPLDGRSDLFSLGVMLYELLCESRPFAGETLSTLVFEILAKEPLAVESIRPGLAPNLYALTNRLLAKDRGERPASAGEAVVHFDALLVEIPPHDLDAPAARHPSNEPTRRMPSSDQLLAASQPNTGPPPVPGGSTGSPATPAGPPAPTLTAQVAPAGHMHPPPPPIPGAPSPPEASSVLPPADRPSPLETGTYSRAKVGKGLAAMMVFLAVLALGILAAGRFFFDRSPAENGAEGTATASSTDPGTTAGANSTELDSAASPAGEGNTDSGDAGDSDSASRPAPSIESSTASQPGAPTQADPTTSTPSPAAAEPGTIGSAEAPPPAASTPPASPRPTPTAQADTTPARTTPRQTRPPTTPPAQPATQAPRAAPTGTSTADTSTADTSTAGTRLSESRPDDPAPAVDREPSRADTFDLAASAAHREMNTGLRFRFDVEPDDTVVKIVPRGERSIVQGRVKDFQAGDNDARDMELPRDGDYLIVLVHPGHGEISVLAHASSSRPPETVRLNLARAARMAAGGPRSIRAGRGLIFSGQPSDAEVWVDGRKVGIASDFTGKGRLARREILVLERGRHQLRLVAPGKKAHEINVEISPGAERRVQRIDYRLQNASDKSP